MSIARKPAPGRPRGARSFDPIVAAAFGRVVRDERVLAGISQEALAQLADVERSYFGRIERGQSQPTLGVVFRLATALGVDAGALVSMAAHGLQPGRRVGKKIARNP